MFGAIWPPICTKLRAKIDKKFVLKTPSKKQLKNIPFEVEDGCSKVEKSSKNDGGSFKITLLAYSQQGKKTTPRPLILESFPNRPKIV